MMNSALDYLLDIYKKLLPGATKADVPRKIKTLSDQNLISSFINSLVVPPVVRPTLQYANIDFRQSMLCSPVPLGWRTSFCHLKLWLTQAQSHLYEKCTCVETTAKSWTE